MPNFMNSFQERFRPECSSNRVVYGYLIFHKVRLLDMEIIVFTAIHICHVKKLLPHFRSITNRSPVSRTLYEASHKPSKQTSPQLVGRRISPSNVSLPKRPQVEDRQLREGVRSRARQESQSMDLDEDYYTKLPNSQKMESDKYTSDNKSDKVRVMCLLICLSTLFSFDIGGRISPNLPFSSSHNQVNGTQNRSRFPLQDASMRRLPSPKRRSPARYATSPTTHSPRRPRSASRSSVVRETSIGISSRHQKSPTISPTNSRLRNVSPMIRPLPRDLSSPGREDRRYKRSKRNSESPPQQPLPRTAVSPVDARARNQISPPRSKPPPQVDFRLFAFLTSNFSDNDRVCIKF